MCSLCPLGAAAASDSNRQVVPEKAHRDPGACAAGVKPSHTGEKKKHTHTQFDTYFVFLPSSMSTDDNPHRAVCYSELSMSSPSSLCNLFS